MVKLNDASYLASWTLPEVSNRSLSYIALSMQACCYGMNDQNVSNIIDATAPSSFKVDAPDVDVGAEADATDAGEIEVS